MEAWPEGAETLTGKRLTVNHGMIIRMVMATVNQNSCRLINLEPRDCEDDKGPEETKSSPSGESMNPFKDVVMEMAD
ncbi:hypothetical protein QQP08_020081 [Theobroma cacao]|nr:hypothetical protein QQP08_020081 [Theobroma cacao]